MTSLYVEAQDFQSVKRTNQVVSHSAYTESLPLTDADAWRWLTSNATQLSFSGGRCTVTVSIYGAERTYRHPDPKTAINLADAALRGAGL